VPGIHLIGIMLVSQVINGILLPFLLVFMMRIVNDRAVMGRHVNGPAHNVLAWGTILVVIALTAALLVMTLLGVG